MLIKILAFASLMSLSQLSSAKRVLEDNDSGNLDAQRLLFKDYCDPIKAGFTQPQCDTLKQQMLMGGGGSSSGCPAASEELADAQGAFTAACSNMGLPRGIQECAKAMDKCKDQSKKEKKSYCPGAPDSERSEKQLEKAEDRLDELKKKIPELQEKVAEGASESNDKIAELRQKGRDALAESTKAIRQAGRDKEEKQSKIVEQMSQLSGQMLQIDEQIGQFELAKSDAAMKRDETKTTIDLNCHQTASATVAKLQSDALGKMQAGVYSRGGQNALLKNVGMSDRESWQKVAEKYYVWCLRSKPTVESKASANRMYTQAIAQTDKAIENAKKRKALLQAQLNRMKDPTGACGSTAPAADGSTGETDTCRANRQAAEDMQQLRQEFEQKQQGLNEDIQRTQTDGARKLAAKQQALASAQSELNDEKTRVNNLRAALDGDSRSKDDISEFRKAHAKWTSAALKVDQCCAQRSSVPKAVCDKNEPDLIAAGYELTPQNSVTTAPSLPSAAPDTIVGSATTPRAGTQSTSTAPVSTGERTSTRTNGEGAR